MNEEENNNKCSIVWTSIPLISWICPLIGHVGVTDSKGITYDFQGTNFINKGKLLFGLPLRQFKIPIDNLTWDLSIEEVSQIFNNVNYNFFFSNCHYFVASVLDKSGYKNNINLFSKTWRIPSTLNIILLIFLKGKNLNFKTFLKNWLPFIFLILIYFFFFK